MTKFASWLGWILLLVATCVFVFLIRVRDLNRGGGTGTGDATEALAETGETDGPSDSFAAGTREAPEAGQYGAPAAKRPGASGPGQAQNAPRGTYRGADYRAGGSSGQSSPYASSQGYNSGGGARPGAYQAPSYSPKPQAWRSNPPKKPSGVPPRDPYFYGDASYALSAAARYVVGWIRECPFADAKREVPKKLREFSEKRPDLEASLRSIAVELGRAETFEELLGAGMLNAPREREIKVGGTAMKVEPTGFAAPTLLCNCTDAAGRTTKNYRLSLAKVADADKLAVVSDLAVRREPAALAARAFLLLRCGDPDDFRNFVRRYGLEAFEPLVQVVAPDGAANR